MRMATRSPRTPRQWRWTRAHLARLPDDGNRYEVLDGALLVTPQARFRHQRVAARLSAALEAYCAAHRLGVVVGPGAVVWAKNELQPDVEVIPVVGPVADDADWPDLPMPSLVVEILSPGSEGHDLHRKREAYLRLGIPVYWALDIDGRRLLEFRSVRDEPLIHAGSVAWQPSDTTEPLVVDLPGLLGT